MSEATEELIKINLEQKGYLVTTSKRINVKNKSHSSKIVLDIVAIKIKYMNFKNYRNNNL